MQRRTRRQAAMGAVAAMAAAAVFAPGSVALAAGAKAADTASADSAATATSSSLDAKIAAEAAGKRPEVSIPFADHGGIRNWRTLGRDALLIEGTHGQWYRVELMGGCFDLPFADRVGFKSNPTGDFDRFSSVFVRGQRCAVKSVTASASPPKSERKAKAQSESTDAQVDGTDGATAGSAE